MAIFATRFKELNNEVSLAHPDSYREVKVPEFRINQRDEGLNHIPP